ncbi:MAG: hypothetical protein AAGH65_09535, partial [Pseudomonadota bacterium]
MSADIERIPPRTSPPIGASMDRQVTRRIPHWWPRTLAVAVLLGLCTVGAWLFWPADGRRLYIGTDR